MLLIEELRRLDEYDIHYLCRNTDPEYSPHGYSTYQNSTYFAQYVPCTEKNGAGYYLPEWIVGRHRPGIHLRETFRRSLDLQICSVHSIMPLLQKN